MTKVREAAKSDNADAIKSAVSELEQASHALSKTLYESRQPGAAGPGGQQQPGDGKAPGDEEVVDAEFEVKE